MDGYLRLLSMYSPAATQVNHNLIGSHDTPRFLTAANGRMQALELATLFQLTTPGAPGLYYGDEFSMEGEDDPWCRGAVPWGSMIGDRSKQVAEMSALRNHHTQLRVGGFRLIEARNRLIVFERRGPSVATVAINDGEAPVRLELAGTAEPGSSAELVLTVGEGATMLPNATVLAPHSGAVWVHN
jgi:neopullulanase